MPKFDSAQYGRSLSSRTETPDLARSRNDEECQFGRGARHAISKILGVLASVGLLVAALSFFLTPPVGDAAALVAQQDSEHGKIHSDPTPPPRFVAALIATEDHRFNSPFDPGLDLFAVARVTFDLLSGRRGDLGGSTVEQQLAKMLYTPQDRGFEVKFEQVLIGVKLRFAYSKAQILKMYADIVYFGDGYYGLENASCGYFGKAPADLSWSQAAMLAGVLNGPSIFDPRTHFEGARRRQEHVFVRLVAVGILTEAQAQAALAGPLGLTERPTGTVFTTCP